MNTPSSALRRIAVALAALACALPVHAEKADRTHKMAIEADRSGTADVQNQISRWIGNVVITQGSLQIKADRVEVRETPDGYFQATAWGTATTQVSYRQKREGVDEYVEGLADRVEFDGRSEVLRLIGNGVARRLRGKTVVDEIKGSLITWNHAAELFSVENGSRPAGATPGANAASASGGRVRAEFVPKAASAPR